eukprot:TRINITY_DN100_c0_g1_i4.p1 TRINITY_DN100_c0_g1~~TRINITY_DN100_c0_g1_i4.p1  ORF type:complete len:290 (+),score=6.14 TRINITY_DN100_c0_g1_i4:177-1046(+)
MASTDHSGKACYIKALPESQQSSAATISQKVFSPNAPTLLHGTRASAEEPAALALYSKKYWGPEPRTFTVSFLESPAADLCTKIISFMNAWDCSITFEQAPSGSAGNVRISLAGEGYWSYLGTDILLVPVNQPTMNLQGFNMDTSDTEFHRVVCHETGHTLGFPHEQLRKEIVNRIDHEKAYAWFKAWYGWSKQMVDNNVLSPIDDDEISGNATDEQSIMAYHLPASIMKDGNEVHGGDRINSSDMTFCHTVYPPSTKPPMKVADLNLPKVRHLRQCKLEVHLASLFQS